MEQGQGDHDRGNEQTHDAGTFHGILVVCTITARKIPGKYYPGSQGRRIRAVSDRVESVGWGFRSGFDEEVCFQAKFSGGPMPAPYSQDLRDRVASAVSSGSSARGAAKRFGIGIGTAVRWAQRLRAEGHARARAMGGDRRSRLSEHRDAVLTLIAHQPDLTLEEIRSALIERHGITVGQGTVSRFLKSHNITLKKKSARRRAAAS